MNPFKMHVISNTHWDREWLYSFQETRMQLIDTVDAILELLESNPEYKFFTFDGQTIAFEDYLEIKPENRIRLERLIKAGKLLIGPWYCLPEETLIDGECIVRNLFIGHKLARSLGKVTKFGYTASSVAQCSQMPQIMQGFGIDGMFFYRGITPEVVPAEFRWQSPDGSEILATRISPYPRYNFFFFVFRPIVYGMGWGDRVYSWEMGGLPMRPCSEGEEYEHYFALAPREYFHSDKVLECVHNLVEIQRQHETTDVLAGMQGMDSTTPHPAEVRIIAEANKQIKRKALVHSNIVNYFKEMRKHLKNPPLMKGELKYAQTQVFSSRTYLKQLNGRVENLLIHWAEPWASIAWLNGNEYPSPFLDLAWRFLISNHSHDSIHGCGSDTVHLDVEHRFRQVTELSRSLLRRAFSHFVKKIDLPPVDKETIYFVVFNASPHTRSDIIKLAAEIPQEWKSTHFRLIDPDGNEVDYQLIGSENVESVVRHPRDVTMAYLNQRCHIRMQANGIPSYGYKVFKLIKARKNKAKNKKLISPANGVLENEFLRVQINPNGTLTVKDKQTGRVYKNFHYFEDISETGTPWDFTPLPDDKPITTLAEKPGIKLIENGELFSAYRISYKWQLPEGLDKIKNKRSSKKTTLHIQVEVGLAKGKPLIEFRTSINNTAKDHRLRVMFPSGFSSTKVSIAGTPYDIVTRPVEQKEIKKWVIFPPFPTHPFIDFVAAHDKKSGIAVFSDDLFEYELTNDKSRTLAMTLIRAFELKLPTVSYRWEVRPDQIGSQCLRQYEFRYAVYFYPPSQQHLGSVLKACRSYLTPLRAVQCGAREPSLGDPELPQSFSFFEVEPADRVFIGAVKKADTSNHLIVRIFNPTDEKVKAQLRFYRPISSAWLTNLEEKNLAPMSPKGKNLSLTIAPKKIVTVKLKFKQT